MVASNCLRSYQLQQGNKCSCHIDILSEQLQSGSGILNTIKRRSASSLGCCMPFCRNVDRLIAAGQVASCGKRVAVAGLAGLGVQILAHLRPGGDILGGDNGQR